MSDQPALVVDLERAKAHLKVKGFDYDDALLPDYLAAAQRTIENHVGPLTPRTVTDNVTLLGRSGPTLLALNTIPVLSVTSVVDSTSGQPYAAGTLNSAVGLVTWVSGGPSTGSSCVVTYVAGRDPVPGNLQLAVLEMLRHLFRSYRSARPNGAQAATPMRDEIPATVKALLVGEWMPGFA